MSTNDTFAVLVSMLQRKMERLRTLQSLAETGQFRDDGRLLAELQDTSADICQVTYVLFLMDRRGVSGNRRENVTHFGALTYADVREVAVKDLLGRLSVEDELHAKMIRDAVKHASRQTVEDSDLTSVMQREIFKLQEDVASLQNLADATRPASLVSIVMRVGLVTIAAAGAVAPATALVFNDPIGKKMLEAALGTFIGVALVEAGTVGIDGVKRRQDQANRKSKPDIRERRTIVTPEASNEEPNIATQKIEERPIDWTQNPHPKTKGHTK